MIARPAALAAAALLAACAPLHVQRAAYVPAEPPAAFQLEGRVSVKAGEQSFSGGMSWRHSPDAEELLLSTPLGQGVAELRGDASGVLLLDAEGRSHQAADAETLVRQTLGVTLPLNGLSRWVVGGVRPGSDYLAEADEQGRLAVLTQDGWRIEFSRHADVSGRVLPGKLIARRGDDLEIRLVADRWTLP